MGAVVLGGGIHRLARQIGLKQAMGMVLTAHRVIAEAGFRIGLVNQVVETDALDTTVIEVCEKILRCAELASEVIISVLPGRT